MNYNQPMFDYCGIEVIESEQCMQAYKLTDFTKELMGHEWVEKFNATTGAWLPKQPACYMIGRDKMIVHPSVSQAIRNKFKKQNETNWNLAYSLNAMRQQSSILAVNCTA